MGKKVMRRDLEKLSREELYDEITHYYDLVDNIFSFLPDKE